jgi:hypothetical protein
VCFVLVIQLQFGREGSFHSLLQFQFGRDKGSSYSFCNFNLVERGNFPFFLQFQFGREREFRFFCNFNLVERELSILFAISIG